jgi:hypothetical protein
MSNLLKYKIAIFILILVNLSLLFHIYYFLDNLKENQQQHTETGFLVNGLVSGVSTDATFNKSSGYSANLGDTVLIDHNLIITSFSDSDKIKAPKNYLFELNVLDSTFSLISEKHYTGNNSFEYHVKNSSTKLLFFKAIYPIEDSYSSLHSLIELTVVDTLGTKSHPYMDSELDFWYGQFVKKYGGNEE